MKTGHKFLVGCGVIALIIVAALVAGLVAVGTVGPDTAIYPGPQVPKRFMTSVRSLKLIDEGETMQYFYSDALWDIKEGMYFVTDQKLVLYVKSQEVPATVIPLDQITSLLVEYNGSFFEDSIVAVESKSGVVVTFPLSSEKGLDKKFVQAMEQKGAVSVETSFE